MWVKQECRVNRKQPRTAEHGEKICAPKAEVNKSDPEGVAQRGVVRPFQGRIHVALLTGGGARSLLLPRSTPGYYLYPLRGYSNALLLLSLAGGLAVGVEADDLAEAEFADALLDLAQVADDDPDDLAGAHELLRGGVELRVGQGAHVRRVARPVVGRQPVVNHPHGRAFQGVERLET